LAQLTPNIESKATNKQNMDQKHTHTTIVIHKQTKRLFPLNVLRVLLLFFLYCTINDRLRTTAFLDNFQYTSRINTLNDIDKIENILTTIVKHIHTTIVKHIHTQQLSYTNKQNMDQTHTHTTIIIHKQTKHGSNTCSI
jgi:hypothetical protein